LTVPSPLEQLLQQQQQLQQQQSLLQTQIPLPILASSSSTSSSPVSSSSGKAQPAPILTTTPTAAVAVAASAAATTANRAAVVSENQMKFSTTSFPYNFKEKLITNMRVKLSVNATKYGGAFQETEGKKIIIIDIDISSSLLSL